MSKKRKHPRSGMTSSLSQHRRSGKRLTSPLMSLRNVQLSSWYRERLPNMLWAALIITVLKREEALEIFRQVAATAGRLGKDTIDGVEHSKLSKLDADNFDELFGCVFRNSQCMEALQPLIALSGLPDAHHWRRHLQPGSMDDHAKALAIAVHENFNDQSQAATDCRWLKVLVLITTDRLKFVGPMARHAREIIDYPNYGDQRSVRPSVRATEIGIQSGEEIVDLWPEAFWKECWENTQCIVVPKNFTKDDIGLSLIKEYQKAYIEVGNHSLNSSVTTTVDARFDSVFGIVLFSLAAAMSVIGSGGHRKIEGRLVLRLLVEAYITLSYLMMRDEPALWGKYRAYGNGQIKLTYLKLYEGASDQLPSYITLEDLERLANEDMWQEYTNIELGSWSGIDLRKMSDIGLTKEIYDKYYGWPSAYVHAQWPSVREVVFDQCLNPLHQYHRVPAIPNLKLTSVAPDLNKIANLLLEKLSIAYPVFKRRIRIPVASGKSSSSQIE